MSTILLIHGAFSGKFVWEAVKTNLEAVGYSVLTIDLPAHGEDQRQYDQVSTADYLNEIKALITNQSEQITLVGHSMAGILISQIGEMIPEKIKELIYVSAYLPQNGQSLMDLGSTDSESILGPNLQFTSDGRGGTLTNEKLLEIFAHDLDSTTAEVIVSKDRVEPLEPFQYKVSLSQSKFGSVHKYYVKTLNDRAVGPSLQDGMIKADGNVIAQYAIDSGHSPYFAKPGELSKIISEIAG